MERGLSQRHLHRHFAGPVTSSRRSHHTGGQKLSSARERAGDCRAPEQEVKRIGAEEAIYIAAVSTLYCGLPDTPLRPSPTDQAVARQLRQDAVPLTLVE